MKIFIDKVLNESVFFSTDYGNGKGVWKGNERASEKEYFVELDVDMIYRYDDFTVSKVKEYQIKMCDEKIQLILLLLEYDELGCASFRLGDSIIEIETEYDERFLALENSYVSVFVEKLYIYDENI